MHLPGLKLQLVSKVNHDRLEGVLGGDLQFDLNRYLDVLVVGSNNFLRRLVQLECKLV